MVNAAGLLGLGVFWFAFFVAGLEEQTGEAPSFAQGVAVGVTLSAVAVVLLSSFIYGWWQYTWALSIGIMALGTFVVMLLLLVNKRK